MDVSIPDQTEQSMMEVLVWKAPKPIGFSGAEAIDICTQISGVPSIHWASNLEACTYLVHKSIEERLILFSAVIIVIVFFKFVFEFISAFIFFSFAKLCSFRESKNLKDINKNQTSLASSTCSSTLLLFGLFSWFLVVITGSMLFVSNTLSQGFQMLK